MIKKVCIIEIKSISQRWSGKNDNVYARSFNLSANS